MLETGDFTLTSNVSSGKINIPCTYSPFVMSLAEPCGSFRLRRAALSWVTHHGGSRGTGTERETGTERDREGWREGERRKVGKLYAFQVHNLIIPEPYHYNNMHTIKISAHRATDYPRTPARATTMHLPATLSRDRGKHSPTDVNNE